MSRFLSASIVGKAPKAPREDQALRAILAQCPPSIASTNLGPITEKMSLPSTPSSSASPVEAGSLRTPSRSPSKATSQSLSCRATTTDNDDDDETRVTLPLINAAKAALYELQQQEFETMTRAVDLLLQEWSSARSSRSSQQYMREKKARSLTKEQISGSLHVGISLRRGLMAQALPLFLLRASIWREVRREGREVAVADRDKRTQLVGKVLGRFCTVLGCRVVYRSLIERGVMNMLPRAAKCGGCGKRYGRGGKGKKVLGRKTGKKAQRAVMRAGRWSIGLLGKTVPKIWTHEDDDWEDFI